MPYIVGLPDGRNVEFPDDVSKDAAASILRKQFNLPGPETTVLGNIKEAVKGVVPGAVSLVEGAVTGASAMLPDEYEKAARAKTKEVAGAIKAPFAAAPGYEDTVGRKFGEAVGSTVPFFALAPLGVAGALGAVGTGVAAGAGEARTRAEEGKATDEQRRTATGLGAVVGATEALPVFSFLKKIGKPAADALLDKVRRAAVTGGQEGAQEIVSAALQNAIAKGIYKPDQSIIEGTGEAGAYGAGVGAFIQGITDMALGKRAKRSATGAPEAPSPIDQAIAAEAEARAKTAAEAAAQAAAGAPTGGKKGRKGKATAATPEATVEDQLAEAAQEPTAPVAEETPVIPEPTVRKKGASNAPEPAVVEPGEAAPIEPSGTAAVVPSVGVDSGIDAVTAAAQPEGTGVGVSELPTTDGNAPESITAPTVTIDGRPFTVTDQTDTAYVLSGGKGTTTVVRNSKLGRAIEAQLGTEPAAIEAPVAEAPVAEVPAEAPVAEVPTPAAIEVPAVEAPAEVPEVPTTSRMSDASSAIIKNVIDRVGIYNSPSSSLSQRFVATDFLYEVATDEDTPKVARDFALRALKNAIDPSDMRPSLRGKYDEAVKDVEEDNTNWGSYKNVEESAASVTATAAAAATPEFVSAVSTGKTRKAIQEVFRTSPENSIIKLVAERLLKASTLPKLSVAPSGVLRGKNSENIVGEYNAARDEARLDESVLTPSNLIHEVMHGFFASKIDMYLKGNPDAQIKRIDDLYQHLLAEHPQLNKQYGMRNLQEFVAEAMSNSEFQALLKDIPYKKSNYFRAFAQAVLRVLGITDKVPAWNAAAEALLSVETAMDSGRALQESRKNDYSPALPKGSDANILRNIATPGATAAAAQADVIGTASDPTLSETAKQVLGAKLNRSYLADKLSSIDRKLTAGYAGRLFDALGNINPSELLAQAQDAPRIVERAFIEGFLELTPDGMFTATKGKLANGEEASLKRIFEIVNASAKQSGNSLEAERKVLSALLVGHREFELDKYNKSPAALANIELRIKDDVKRNELERQFQANPDAKKVLEVMDAMRFNRIDMMVTAGRISQDKADFWKSTSGYVPFQDMEALVDKIASHKTGSTKGLSSVAKYKPIHGGDTQVGDSIDAFIGVISNMGMDAVKNNAVSKASQSLTRLGHAKRISPAAPLTQQQEKHTVKTYINGVLAKYYFDDPLDAAAFAGMPGEISTVVTLMQQSARVLRAGVTLGPKFAVGQVLQDITRAYALSDVTNPAALIPRILLNFPRAAFGELTGRKSAGVIRMENMGVTATFDISTRGTVKSILQEVGAEKRNIGELILHAAESISKGSDIAVRQAIYEQSMKETGGNEALSMSRAREIINFSRRGNSKVVDFMVRTVPFTNAYIRGMDKLYTAATGKGNMYGMTQAQAKSMFRNRMLTLGGIGFIYALMMAGDEEYEALDDNIRDSRFIVPGVKFGETPLAIPLPRDLAFIFKAIPERVVNYMRKYGTEEEKSGIRVIGELMKQGVGVIAAPNATPTMILPVLETITNYSFFLDRALESQSQKAKESFMAYGRGTSEMAKAASEGLSGASKALGDVGLESVGGAIEMSPVKLENLFRGLLGTSASLILSVGDELLAPERTEKPLHKSIVAEVTGAGAIMVDPVGRKQLNALYDLYEKISKVHNTFNELDKTNPEKAVEYGKARIPELDMYGTVSAMYKDIQELNKLAREIDAAKDIAPEERMRLIANVIRDQNKIAKDVGLINAYIEKSR